MALCSHIRQPSLSAAKGSRAPAAFVVTRRTMPKKKKKKSSKRHDIAEEAKEELGVLAAIFGDQFTLDEDARGFVLHIVPHPGRTEPNYVFVQLTVRLPAAYSLHTGTLMRT